MLVNQDRTKFTNLFHTFCISPAEQTSGMALLPDIYCILFQLSTVAKDHRDENRYNAGHHTSKIADGLGNIHALLSGSCFFIVFPFRTLRIHDQIHNPAFLPDEQSLYFVHPNWDIILPLSNSV